MQIHRRKIELRLLPLLLLVGIGLMLLSLGAAIATRHFIVLPQLRELEAIADRKDLRRVLLVIDNKKLQLSTLAYQGAVDDSSYAFSQHPDPKTFDVRAPYDTLSNLRIDLVAVLDRDNQLIGLRFAREIEAEFDTALIKPTDLIPLLIDLRRVKERAPLFNAGFAQIPNGPIIYGVASIMRTDTTGESGGNLFLATRFDEELRRDIEHAAQLSLRFAEPNASDMTAPARAPETLYRDNNDRLKWLLRDDAGKPILKLIVALPRRDYDTNLLALPVLVSFGTSLFGFSLILLIFRNVLITPMLAIGSHLRRVREEGDYNLRLDSAAQNEIGDLSRDIDALVQHVQIQRDQLQAQTAAMQTLSFQDGLTGLANRRRFDQALADNWALAYRAQAPLALVMFDVDYFKNYNDHYGHQMGDEALKNLAAIVRTVVVRQSDVASRYGGEEFAILLPNTSESGAERIAEQLKREVLKAAIPHQQSRVSDLLTISIGVAAIKPDAYNSQSDLVRRTDAALYSSKARGRNCITLASRLTDF